MKRFLGWAAVAALLLAGCAAPGLPAVTLPGTPGFLQGLWHGMIFPITFVVSLFDHGVGVYAAVNDGGWYNFGFFLGIALSMGGSAGAGSRGRRKKPQAPKAT
jgi:hypothetical protein